MPSVRPRARVAHEAPAGACGDTAIYSAHAAGDAFKNPSPGSNRRHYKGKNLN
jgi:hypothetical protein